MAAIEIAAGQTREIASVGTTLQQLTYGDGCSSLYVSGDSALYVVRDASKSDGDAVGSTARFGVASGTVMPVGDAGLPTFVCAQSGTATVWVMGLP